MHRHAFAVRVPRAAVCALFAACAGSTAPSSAPLATHPAGTVDSIVALPQRPFGTAISSLNAVFLTRLDDATLVQGTIGSGGYTSAVLVGNVPTDVAFTPDGASAFVANQADDAVGVVNVASRGETATLPLTASAYRVRVNGAGTKLYATTAGTDLFVFNATTLASITTLTVGAQANGLAFDSSGNTLYVSSRFAGTVTKVDVATNSVNGSLPVGGRPQDIAISHDGTELWVADEVAGVQLYQLPSGAPVLTVANTVGAFGLALTPDGTQLYVTMPSMSKAVVIDRASRTVLHDIPGVLTPRRIAFDRTGAFAVIADEGAGAILIK